MAPSTNPDPSTTRYIVADASGVPQAIHCRRDRPNGKQLWWELPDGSRGLGGLALANLPLYGIHGLDRSSFVILVEGEKSAEALRTIGLPGVGTVTGASGTPSRRVLAELTGLRVFVWADADPVGRSHMDRIAAMLVEIAAEVRIVDWPESPDHGDAADFIAAGANAAAVLALLEAADPFVDGVGPGVVPSQTLAWEAPMSLDRRDRLPVFPVATLPAWLRLFVEAEAEATQTPLDMAAMFGLAALATVVGGRVEIEPADGWREGLNLFVVVAMEAGSRKSAVHADINVPIVEYEQLLVDQAKPDIAEQATIRRIAEAALAKAEKAAASAKDPDERKAAEDRARTYASALDVIPRQVVDE